MNALQKTFSSQKIDELDNLVNTFAQTEKVIATQCYAVNHGDGVIVHYRVLFYFPDTTTPTLKVQQQDDFNKL